jgi:ferric-dicitrate binding protein FerR (iron transport regulator)
MKIAEDKLWDLISKDIANSISGKEKQELMSVLEQDPQLKRTYDTLNVIEPVIDTKNQDTMKEDVRILMNQKIFAGKSKKTAQFRSLPYWLTIAAMFILLFSLGYYTFTLNQVSEIEVNTPKGVYSKIELPDGTMVHLNSGSKMIYPHRFKGKTRNVKLWGEGYFDVKKDNAPFIVSSQRIRVKVLGTAFNFKNYPSDSIGVVTLERGSIELSMVNHKQKFVLKPNEQIVLNKNKSQLQINRLIDAGDFSSWKDGEFIFKSISFPDLCNNLERRYNYNFVIKNSKYNHETFTGKFKHGESIQQIMEIIKINTSIKYKIEKDSVYIY